MRRRSRQLGPDGLLGAVSRGLALLAASFLSAFPALAVPPVPLPPGSAWLAHAPRADVFARSASAMLDSVSRRAPTLSAAHQNVDALRRSGLALLSPGELAAQGVRTDGAWTLFERSATLFLATELRDTRTFSRAMDAWAASRGLRQRSEAPLPGRRGRLVAWARGKGTRPATGWAIASDRAVIMLDAGSTKSLEAAFAAMDGAAPARPPVEAPLVLHFAKNIFWKEAWLGITPSGAGLDATGIVAAEGELFVRDAARADWVRAAASEAPGSAGMPFVHARFLAGPALAASMADPLRVDSSGARLLDTPAFAALGAGPVQWLLSAPDTRALQAVRGVEPSDAVVRALSLRVSLPGRSPEAVRHYRDALGPAAGATRLEDGVLVLRHGADEPGPPAIAVPQPSCTAGAPVAAARVEPAVLGRAMAGIGLLSAMGSDTLMGVFALNTAYGSLLRGSGPLTALACVESPSRVRVSAHWPLAQ